MTKPAQKIERTLSVRIGRSMVGTRPIQYVMVWDSEGTCVTLTADRIELVDARIAKPAARSARKGRR